MLGVLAKIIGTAIVLGACVFAALFMLNKFENPTNEFANYSEVEASGLIEAGWVPKVIPKSAFEIFETHNLDSNTVRMSFRFKLGDTGIAENKCQQTSAKGIDQVFTCREGILTLSEEGYGYFTSE